MIDIWRWTSRSGQTRARKRVSSTTSWKLRKRRLHQITTSQGRMVNGVIRCPQCSSTVMEEKANSANMIGSLNNKSWLSRQEKTIYRHQAVIRRRLRNLTSGNFLNRSKVHRSSTMRFTTQTNHQLFATRKSKTLQPWTNLKFSSSKS